MTRPAIVGNLSRGGSSLFTPTTEHALERAMHWARKRNEEPTIEHFLLALLHEHDAQQLLQRHQVDLPTLREQLLIQLESDPSPAESLTTIMQRVVETALAASPSRTLKTTLGGADVVIAILNDDQTHAARHLKNHGLTLISAQEHQADIQQARTQKEQEQTAHVQQQLQALESPVVTQQIVYADPLFHRYKLRVSRAETMTDQVGFKGAVSCDGELTLLIEKTPYERELTGSQIAGLFQALNQDRIHVELIDPANEDQILSGFCGQSGAIFRDPRHAELQRSGTMEVRPYEP